MREPESLFDLGCEQDLLGGLLHGLAGSIRMQVVRNCCALLEPEDFSSPLHADCFRILAEHVTAGGGFELLHGTPQAALDQLLAGPHPARRNKLVEQALGPDDHPLFQKLVARWEPEAVHRMLWAVGYSGSVSLVPERADRLRDLRLKRERWRALQDEQAGLLE